MVIPAFQSPASARNRADGTQNRDNNCEPNLAAYPQSFNKRILHRLNRSPFLAAPNTLARLDAQVCPHLDSCVDCRERCVVLDCERAQARASPICRPFDHAGGHQRHQGADQRRDAGWIRADFHASSHLAARTARRLASSGPRRGTRLCMAWAARAWRTGRILAAETGPAAAEEGTIADLAASPNGLTLATAMVAPGGNRVDVIIRDLIATGAGNVIASFNGRYDSISMNWLNNATIALALRRHPEPLENPASTTKRRSPIQTEPDAAAAAESRGWIAVDRRHWRQFRRTAEVLMPDVGAQLERARCLCGRPGRCGRSAGYPRSAQLHLHQISRTRAYPRARLGPGRRRVIPVCRARPLAPYDRRIQVQHSDGRRKFDGRIDRRGLVRGQQQHDHAGQSEAHVQDGDRASRGAAACASRNIATRTKRARREIAGLRQRAGNARAEHDGVFAGRA